MGLLYNLLFCRKILLCSLGLNIMLDLCILKTTGTFTFISNCNVSTKFFVCPVAATIASLRFSKWRGERWTEPLVSLLHAAKNLDCGPIKLDNVTF